MYIEDCKLTVVCDNSSTQISTKVQPLAGFILNRGKHVTIPLCSWKGVSLSSWNMARARLGSEGVNTATGPPVHPVTHHGTSTCGLNAWRGVDMDGCPGAGPLL
jgi:hypothetical protein